MNYVMRLAAVIVVMALQPSCHHGAYRNQPATGPAQQMRAKDTPVMSVTAAGFEARAEETVEVVAAAECGADVVVAIADVSVMKEPGSGVFFYESGMMIDADGAPNAYHPHGQGLCYLANAGKPGNWWGIATDAGGEPFIQGPDDPFPGYYVSTTSLQDETLDVDDPRRYVDATAIPYVVLPGRMDAGANLGDFGLAYNARNGKLEYAIYADVGPRKKIGEGSVALARALNVPFSSKRGGVDDGIVYVIFPGSGNGLPRTVAEIRAEGERLFEEWGGMEKLLACMPG